MGQWKVDAMVESKGAWMAERWVALKDGLLDARWVVWKAFPVVALKAEKSGCPPVEARVFASVVHWERKKGTPSVDM